MAHPTPSAADPTQAEESGVDQSPFLTLDRAAWSRLRASDLVPLSEDDLNGIRGLGDEIDLDEVREVYLPLARLLEMHARATAQLAADRADFFDLDHTGVPRPPFVIGVAGSVAVGKSTTARLLQMLLARTVGSPTVALITTDGFLLPNAELEHRGILRRKGFPESYDRRALLRFVSDLKSGVAEVSAPVYSHLVYDVVPGEFVTFRRPDIVVVEGLNVLQPARTGHPGPALAVSDYFDFSIYVDADPEDLRNWYVQRFLRLRETAFQNPASYFHRYGELTEAAAIAKADELWSEINLPNLVDNIAPTRDRASLVLGKGGDHSVAEVSLRKM